MQQDGICGRGYTELGALTIFESKLSASLSGVLVFGIKLRLWLHCQSAVILYVLGASFSNSCVDFFLFFSIKTDPFLWLPHSLSLLSWFQLIFLGQFWMNTASLVLDKAWSKLGFLISDFLPLSKSDSVLFALLF